ncbi:cytochrome P450 [Basidiobolus meristosporus CBS 931.73]|uniref:Cytochrome P450 n=1 Tax=Basidiobolus meristosporus CBS 931.73 TaxID=1314790 RepID=A0A1Y1WA43_9FUNG|nr:cytochrome P450 [Basidiobolus meristosporus CBS 931.73]|eukprot:ORX70393.1 cytochrome P450 [Basidiobolus meristosporus CBS 931.73]
MSFLNTLYSAALFLGLYFLGKYLRNQRASPQLNEPPNVPYFLPLVGHSLQLYLDPKRFLKKCNQQYGDIFNLFIMGKRVTVVRDRYAMEMFRAPDKIVVPATADDFLHMDYMLDYELIHSVKVDPVTTVVKEEMTASKGKRYALKIVDRVRISIDKLLGTGDHPVIVEKPMEFSREIFARISARVFAGEECKDNEEIITSFKRFSQDVVKAALFFDPFPRFMYPYIAPWLTPLTSPHHQVLLRYVTPIVEERRQKAATLGEAWETEKPQDILQFLIENEELVDRPAKHVVLYLLATLFASIHTTSTNTTLCLFELANHPKMMEILREEQISVLASNNNQFDSNAIDKMKLLDSFIREVLRHGDHMLGMRRKSVDVMEFSNGYQIPPGRTILPQFYHTNMVTGEDFDPFQFAANGRLASGGGNGFITFGLGKHACPGRWFAILAIKIILATVIQNYDLKSVSGKHVEPWYALGMFTMTAKEPLIFTKCQK